MHWVVTALGPGALRVDTTGMLALLGEPGRMAIQWNPVGDWGTGSAYQSRYAVGASARMILR